MKNTLYSAINNQSFCDAITSNSPYGIIVLNETEEILAINKMALEIFDIKEKEWKKTDIKTELIVIDEFKTFFQAYKKGQKRNFELEKIKYHEKTLKIHCKSTSFGLMLFVHDISGLDRIEMDLMNSAIQSQEDERRRIAKEIHDGIGPLLSAIKLNIQNLSYEEAFSPEQKNQLNDAIQLLDNVTDDLRSLSHALMPKILEDFGLVAAIENQINKLSGKKKDLITFYQSVNNERFDRMVELNIFRIFQELLNNALKHASASRIHVQLIRHSESIILMVEDDGIGFNYTKVMNETKGIGLLNIESRTKAIGSILTLDASPDFGVNCIIEVPIN